jgi:hypothetical protein
MSSQLNRLYATEISRLQKAEWLEHYAKARSIAITSKNICAGWRGAGLFPTNVNRILHVLPDPPSTPPLPPRNISTTQPLLITSSPPDGIVLRTTNAVFNEAISNAALVSPVRKHAQRLSGVAEHLHAENSMLRHENAKLKQLISKRKEQASGK